MLSRCSVGLVVPLRLAGAEQITVLLVALELQALDEGLASEKREHRKGAANDQKTNSIDNRKRNEARDRILLMQTFGCTVSNGQYQRNCGSDLEHI
jgi:hypothetical protein